MNRIYAGMVGATIIALISLELAGWRGLKFDPVTNRIHAITLVAAGASLERISYFTPRRLALWCGIGYTIIGLIGIGTNYPPVVMPHTNPAEPVAHLIIGLAGLFVLGFHSAEARVPHAK